MASVRRTLNSMHKLSPIKSDPFRTICRSLRLGATALGVSLFLQACQNGFQRPSAERGCEGINHHKEGFTLGAEGNPLPEKKAIAKGGVGPFRNLCSVPDTQWIEFKIGYEEGLNRFCSYSSGFDRGYTSANISIGSICPPQLRSAFELGFKDGKKIVNLDRKIKDLESKLTGLNSAQRTPNSPGKVTVLGVERQLANLKNARQKALVSIEKNKK